MVGRQDRQKQAARRAAATRTGATDPDLSGGPAAPDLSGGTHEAPAGQSAQAGAGAPAAGRARGRGRSGGSTAVEATASAETHREAPQGEHVVSTSGKGRPTPKRREAEARNRRPVVVTDRKAAKKRAREQRQESYQRQQAGIAAGDERFFLPRDRGRARRYARAFVDARWCIGELMLPVAIVVLILLIFQSLAPQLITYAVLATYSLLILALVDAWVVGFQVKRRLAQRFDPDEIPKWTGVYAGMRSLQVRRLRQPKPQVARGQKID